VKKTGPMRKAKRIPVLKPFRSINIYLAMKVDHSSN